MKKQVSLSGFKGIGRFKINPLCDICLSCDSEYILFDYKLDSQGLVYFEYMNVCSDCLVENFNMDKQLKF